VKTIGTYASSATSLYPRAIGFGLANGVTRRISGKRTIGLSPAHIRTRQAWDEFVAYRITVDGTLPPEVMAARTTFSFEVTTVPQNEEPYDVRFFFESVEWKDITTGWEWTGDWLWDEFVAQELEGEWPKPIQTLGIAHSVDGPSRDPYMREMMTQDQGKVCGGWYRLPTKPSD
jgi:hypothetical protein